MVQYGSQFNNWPKQFKIETYIWQSICAQHDPKHEVWANGPKSDNMNHDTDLN